MDKSLTSQSITKTHSFRLKFTPHLDSWWQDLPPSPGIYIFEDNEKKPLYIGKSINLRSRIKQHLDASKDIYQKQSSFIPQTYYLRFRTTTNDLEAIILESYLIKTILPKYNSASKDDKSEVYLTINNKPNFQFKLVRANTLNLGDYTNPKTQVFGPYNNSATAKNLLKHIRHIFGYCQTPYNASHRPCFYLHLRQCPGACTGIISIQNYHLHLDKIKHFLLGQFKTLIKQITQEINSASKLQLFEVAQKYKLELDRLTLALSRPQLSGFLEFEESNSVALNNLVTSLNHPKLKKPPHRMECFDIAHLQTSSMVGGMSVFIDGEPSPENYRHFIINHPDGGDPNALKEILQRRLKHTEWEVPDLIILDGGIPQLSIVKQIVPENIPLIALSKKRETIHFVSQSGLTNLNLPLFKPSLKMLQAIRNEAHRFTTSFHQKKQRELLY